MGVPDERSAFHVKRKKGFIQAQWRQPKKVGAFVLADVESMRPTNSRRCCINWKTKSSRWQRCIKNEIDALTNKHNAAMTEMAQSYAEKYMKFVEQSVNKESK